MLSYEEDKRCQTGEGDSREEEARRRSLTLIQLLERAACAHANGELPHIGRPSVAQHASQKVVPDAYRVNRCSCMCEGPHEDEGEPRHAYDAGVQDMVEPLKRPMHSWHCSLSARHMHTHGAAMLGEPKDPKLSTSRDEATKCSCGTSVAAGTPMPCFRAVRALGARPACRMPSLWHAAMQRFGASGEGQASHQSRSSSIARWDFTYGKRSSRLAQ